MRVYFRGETLGPKKLISKIYAKERAMDNAKK